jgi:uncharacterized protein YecT (DUF1311 family)
MRNRYLARPVVFAAAAVAVAGLAAGCSSGGSSSSSGASASASATPKPSASGSAAPYAPIVEPFDPGHQARTRTAPADCGSQPSTLAIEQCYEIKTENVDAQINTAVEKLYNGMPVIKVREAIVTQSAAWLATRGTVCKAAFNTGGTIDGISTAACLLDESTARLAAVTAATPAEAILKSTDSIDPNQLSWYTTPEGSRIAEIDTQGDQTGGVIVSWVIVGGAQGFVVNPKQFYYSDGSFTDPGILEGTSFTYHTVKTGVVYQFDIDYSLLSHDPDAGKGTGGFVYAPGTPAAIWK